jgi:hypothetical protein
VIVEGEWVVDSTMMEATCIIEFLGASQVANFDGLKEKAAKFIISRYQNGKIWLDQSNEITKKMYS